MKMHSATIHIDTEILLDHLGLKYFQGEIDSMELIEKEDHKMIVFKISGTDPRLPESEYYPLSNVKVRCIESHFEEVK